VGKEELGECEIGVEWGEYGGGIVRVQERVRKEEGGKITVGEGGGER